MAEHHLFALASSYEGLPHVVVEAMEANLPVVATDAGGTAEVVVPHVTGLLAELDDESLYRALNCLVRDEPLRQRLAAQARTALQGQFTAQTMIERTEAVLFSSAFASRETSEGTEQRANAHP
jgi:glycosyltransferase involved in cell wall biosynthesis